MYKDVKKKITWRKVLAVVVAICLVVTVVQLPNVTVKAEDGIVYHDYTNATMGELGVVEEKTAAAIFTINQNENQGAEQLQIISFDLHKDVEETSTDQATVSIYLNPSDVTNPESGTFFNEITTQSELIEGTNTIQLSTGLASLNAETVVAVVISLSGTDFSFYENTADDTGKTFVKTTEGWVDAGTRSQCINIAMKTSDVKEDDSDESSDDTTDLITEDDTTTTNNTTDSDENVGEDESDEEADAGIMLMSEDDGISAQAEPLDLSTNLTTITVIGNASATTTNPTILVTYDGTVLYENVDYTCSVTTYEGSRLIVVTGMGNYTGSKSTSYEISANDIASVMAATGYAIPDQVYTGSAITLSTAMVGALYTITDSTFSASDLNDPVYINNLNVGTATVIISPKKESGYGGAITATFNITPADIYGFSDSAFDYSSTISYDPEGIEIPTVTITYNGKVLTQGTDYTLTTSGFTQAGDSAGNITIGAATNPNFICTHAKHLYVNISKCVITKSDPNFTVAGVEAQYSYTGSSVIPSGLKLMYKDIVIYDPANNIGTSDFTVTYQNTINYGTASGSILAAADSNFSGVKIFNYEIVKRTLDTNNITVEYDDSADYVPGTGESALTTYIAEHSELLAVRKLGTGAVTFTDAELVLKDGDYTLVRGTDYTVSYQYNSVASTSKQMAQVTLTGKDNYAGSMTLSFLIVKDISTTTITAPTSVPYQGMLNGAIIPSEFEEGAVVLKNGSANTLTLNQDYSLSYENNNVGITSDATLNIQGLGAVTTSGCYVGTATKTFSVTAKNIADEDVIATINDIPYKGGSSVKGVATTIENLDDITITFNGSELSGGEGFDYTVDESSYKNNTAPGTATVNIKGTGNFTGTKTVSFVIIGEMITDYNVSAIGNMTYTGNPIVPSFTVTTNDSSATTLVRNTDYTVSYKNESTGEVTTSITNVGTYTVIITAKDGSIYSGVIEKSGFMVTQQMISNEEEVAVLSIANQAYTSAEINPTVTLRNRTTSKNLVLGTDYTISTWSNNINVSTDTTYATATVTGIGNYTGYRTVSFQISQKNINDSTNIKFSDIETQAYNASVPSEPYFTLTYTVGTTIYELVKDKDYTVTYTNNDKIGRATITATGIGNFTGTKTTTFSILASIESTCDITFTSPTNSDGSYSSDYTGSAIRPAVTVKLKAESGGSTLTQGRDYTIEYSNNINAGTASVIVTGMGNYTSSVQMDYTINQVSMENVDVTLAQSSYTYTGSQIQPVIRYVRYGSYTLNSNDPYTITYGENTNTGAGTMTLTPASSNFIGTKEVNFEITAKSIGSGTQFANGISMDTIEAQDYTGSVITPQPVLHYKASSDVTIDMALNSEYTIDYPDHNNIEPGIVNIKFTGMGNYSGEVTKTFIIARSIEDGHGHLSGIEDKTYTGSAITQDALVVTLDNLIDTAADPEVLDPENYTVTYTPNVNAGEVTVTVTGNESKFYKGTLTETFKIIGDFSDVETTTIAAIDDIPRDPAETDATKVYHPSLLDITCGGNTFNNAESNENYTVTYSNDTRIGTATITITGIGEYYTGEMTTTYDIVPANDVFLIKYANADEETGDAGKIPDQTYCGTGVTFDPESEDFPFTVYYVNEAEGVSERLLTYGVDYELSYTNNTNANVTVDADGNYVDEATKATITITGIGKYKNSNSQTTTFTILPLHLEDLVIDDSEFLPEGSEDEIGPRGYTGKTVTPSSIKINNVDEEGNVICTLTLNTDYTLTPVLTRTVEATDETESPDGETTSATYTYTYEAGEKTACVTITGNGSNCIGTRTIEYDIAKKDIAETKITTTAQEYTGYPLMPDVKVVNPTNDNAVLVLNHDYFLEYENNIDAGTATVRVVANEDYNFTGTAEATFKINPLKITSTSIVIDDIPDQAYSGAGVEPSLNIVYTDSNGVPNTLVEDVDYTLSYANNTKAGTARVTVTGAGNYTGTSTRTFTITPCDIGETNTNIVIAPIENQAFTGSQVSPAVTVTDGTYQMKAGTDYTVSYSDNIQLGTATATILGKGNYTGSRSTTFKIASDISKAVVGAGVNAEYTYTGNEIRPVPSYVHIGTTILTEGTHYTVSYEDNIAAGTGKVILSGIGEYGGTLECDFTILPKNITDADVVLNGYSEKATYTESAVTLPLSLVYGSITLVEGTDYIVAYGNNQSLGTATLTVVSVEGGNYTGIIEKTFEIVMKSVEDDDIVVTGMSSTYTYEGTEVVPVPTLNYGEDTLTQDVDYTLAYTNNNAVGVATMTVTGIGRYQGVREVTYNILRKSIANCTVSSVGTQTYTGSDIEPTVTVSDGSKNLVQGTDYTLMYANNRKTGTGSVIIAGKGNYTVTKTVRFDIRPGDISGLIVNATTNTSMSLSWSAEGVTTGYEIYRLDASGNYTRIARTRGTSFTETGLSSGTSYTYKVRAYLVTEDETYYSSFSDAITGSTNG